MLLDCYHILLVKVGYDFIGSNGLRSSTLQLSQSVINFSINLICCKMAIKHDENKDLRSFGKIGRVDIVSKTLKASKDRLIGIKMWGKIDYLTHYCGWTFVYDNNIVVNKEKTETKEYKKEKKEIRKMKD